MAVPSVDAIRRASGWSSAVDLDTEEGRAFFQDRLAFLGKVAFVLSIATLILGQLALALGASVAARSTAMRGAVAIQATIDVLYLAMWLGCRRGRRSRSVLGFVDAAFPILSTTAAALPLLLWPGAIPGLEWAVLLVLTHTQVGRAVFVPSPPLRTLVIGLLAGAPVVAGLWIDEAARGSAAQAVVVHRLAWVILAAATATVTSSVIYGLRRQVTEARHLGQYTLVEKLGEGGMGVVYRARHAMLRRPTAIKLLRPDKAGAQSLARFEREVQLTAQLSHPNTVSIFDYGRTPDGVFYYAMEYLDGIDLETLVRVFGPQDPGRVVNILRQVAGSLAEAHALGLVHRDVKPANIILCQRGGVPDVAKVVDFGLAKDLEGASSAALTRATDITGTPMYLAPEAITDPETVDGRSDLYALGAVGYYLLAGAHVFEGGTLVEVCSHHLRTPPVAPSARLGRALPPDLESVILSCLEKEAARRPPTADAVSTHLAMCVGVDEWDEGRAREWWEEHREQIRGLARGRAGSTLVSGQTLSMELSARAAGRD
jgi:eukaryotic-like serine/threonine-protein kinase